MNSATKPRKNSRLVKTALRLARVSQSGFAAFCCPQSGDLWSAQLDGEVLVLTRELTCGPGYTFSYTVSQ
jgi:hypothetical protein